MKKNSSLRLKLHRETLRALDGSEAEAARGGTLAACILTAVCQPTQSCPTLCMQNCSTAC